MPSDTLHPAVLYVRNSTEDQAEAGTHENQIIFFERWTELHGIPRADVYLDAGVSGTVPFAERPAGARLLADAQAGRVKEVLVYRLDRLGRTVKVVCDAMDALEKSKARLRSMTENFDTSTPAGKMHMNILATFAAYERDSIVQRTAEGQKRKAAAGGWLGGNRAAYGYHVVGRKQDSHIEIDYTPVPEFAPDATRASIAIWIFEQCVKEKRPASQIAATLNARGIPSYLGVEWHQATIGRMMRNPVYKGLHRTGDELGKKCSIPLMEVPCPALIDTALWDAAQVQLEKNRRLSMKNRKRLYLLAGLIRCGDCGSGYAGRTLPDYRDNITNDGRDVMYRCNKTPSAIGKTGPCPGGKSVSGAIETIVWKQLCHFLHHPEEVATYLDIMEPDTSHEEEKARALCDQLGRDIAAKAGEEAAILTLYRRGKIKAAVLDAQLDEIAKETKVLQDELDRLQRGLHQAAVSQKRALEAPEIIRTIAREVGQLSDEWTPEEKRIIIERLVERVTVRTIRGANGKKDTSVTVQFVFEPKPEVSKNAVALPGAVPRHGTR